jgi:hypothetical protein
MYVCACMCTYVHQYACVCVRVCVCVYNLYTIYIYIYIYIYIHTYIYIYTYIHIYTHTHIYIHRKRVCVISPQPHSVLVRQKSKYNPYTPCLGCPPFTICPPMCMYVRVLHVRVCTCLARAYMCVSCTCVYVRVLHVRVWRICM